MNAEGNVCRDSMGCVLHPAEGVLGVCSSCVSERLKYKLSICDEGRRRRNSRWLDGSDRRKRLGALESSSSSAGEHRVRRTERLAHTISALIKDDNAQCQQPVESPKKSTLQQLRGQEVRSSVRSGGNCSISDLIRASDLNMNLHKLHTPGCSLARNAMGLDDDLQSRYDPREGIAAKDEEVTEITRMDIAQQRFNTPTRTITSLIDADSKDCKFSRSNSKVSPWGMAFSRSGSRKSSWGLFFKSDRKEEVGLFEEKVVGNVAPAVDVDQETLSSHSRFTLVDTDSREAKHFSCSTSKGSPWSISSSSRRLGGKQCRKEEDVYSTWENGAVESIELKLQRSAAYEHMEEKTLLSSECFHELEDRNTPQFGTNLKRNLDGTDCWCENKDLERLCIDPVASAFSLENTGAVRWNVWRNCRKKNESLSGRNSCHEDVSHLDHDLDSRIRYVTRMAYDKAQDSDQLGCLSCSRRNSFSSQFSNAQRMEEEKRMSCGNVCLDGYARPSFELGPREDACMPFTSKDLEGEQQTSTIELAALKAGGKIADSSQMAGGGLTTLDSRSLNLRSRCLFDHLEGIVKEDRLRQGISTYLEGNFEFSHRSKEDHRNLYRTDALTGRMDHNICKGYSVSPSMLDPESRLVKGKYIVAETDDVMGDFLELKEVDGAENEAESSGSSFAAQLKSRASDANCCYIEEEATELPRIPIRSSLRSLFTMERNEMFCLPRGHTETSCALLGQERFVESVDVGDWTPRVGSLFSHSHAEAEHRENHASFRSSDNLRSPRKLIALSPSMRKFFLWPRSSPQWHQRREESVNSIGAMRNIQYGNSTEPEVRRGSSINNIWNPSNGSASKGNEVVEDEMGSDKGGKIASLVDIEYVSSSRRGSPYRTLSRSGSNNKHAIWNSCLIDPDGAFQSTKPEDSKKVQGTKQKDRFLLFFLRFKKKLGSLRSSPSHATFYSSPLHIFSKGSPQ